MSAMNLQYNGVNDLSFYHNTSFISIVIEPLRIIVVIH